jgi:lactate dehydrogenase-like 2-hydroxyacid dehydrogenase
VRYHNRRPVAGSPYEYEANLLDLARWADFLVLSCTGGPQTQNLIDRAVLDALGAKGILINVARGSVVDEPALVAALQEGRLGAAGLDVFADEPRVPAVLCELPNLELLPHIGSATPETRAAMEDLLLDNLDSFLREGRLLTPV